jgi:hypothetical protein
MRASIIAILFAAAALPAVAQTATPRVDARPAVQVQSKDEKAQAQSPMSARERARAAKAQKKKNRELARPRNDSQKKAPAS